VNTGSYNIDPFANISIFFIIVNVGQQTERGVEYPCSGYSAQPRERQIGWVYFRP
jgi:hypothetical protein